jgi:hypothetical protein
MGNGRGPVLPLTKPNEDLEAEAMVPVGHIRWARGVSLHSWLRLRQLKVRCRGGVAAAAAAAVAAAAAMVIIVTIIMIDHYVVVCARRRGGGGGVGAGAGVGWCQCWR